MTFVSCSFIFTGILFIFLFLSPAHQNTADHCRRGESYGIPYRILCAKGVRNLLTAGRCVSTDQKAPASMRVMPACYITGQAAGMAAAIAAGGSCDVHTVDVKELRRRLVGFGAYLPNAGTCQTRGI